MSFDILGIDSIEPEGEVTGKLFADRLFGSGEDVLVKQGGQLAVTTDFIQRA